jgi:shikimate dehydrogenase
MKINATTQLCIIIGDPVAHSLSPAMHNAAYQALGIDDQFVFVAARVRSEDLETVAQAVRAMRIRGLTCTIPHKIEIMQYLDEVDAVAKTIGAVNTVVNINGRLVGYNTDWLGVITPLTQRTSLKGKRVALIGAGGAARAMAYGVTAQGAELSIFNRTRENAEEIARDLGGSAYSFDELPQIQDHDIILNATSVGMGEQEGISPVPPSYLHAGQIVFDAVYKPRQTRLLQDAATAGAECIEGWEMLLHQGTAQFELYTGKQAPVDIMKQIITP